MADDWEEEAMPAPVANGGASYYDGSGSGGYGGGRGRGRGGAVSGRGRGRGADAGDDTCRKCGLEGHMSWDCTSGGGGVGGGGRSTACFKCNEEGHMSRDCPNSSNSGGGGGGRACYKCGDEGHMSRDCPSGGGGGGSGSRACYKCNEEGHMSRDCPNSGSGGGGGSRACYKCGEEGHMSRDCPSAGGGGGGGGSSSRGCYKCGEEGHMSRDCTSEGGGGGGGRSERPKGCFNCGEDGHNKADCPNPAKPRDPADELDSDGKPRPPLYVPEHITDEQLFCEGVQSGINFNAYESIPVSATGDGFIPPRMEAFSESGLRPLLINNVEKAGYTCPTPIQRHCVPTIMAGRDIMGCAQTGSGKTAAFLLPILHRIIEGGASGSTSLSSGAASPEAVVLAPTRELAIQIHNEARKFAMNSMVRVVVCYGGASTNSQHRQLQAGCSVLVATPGRLMDFLDKGRIDFSNIKFVVLDEADRMLDMGFVNEIDKMMNHSTMPPLKDRQTLLFSATFPEEVQTMAGKYLNNYVFYVVGIVGAANTDVVQEVLNVPRNQKREMLVNKLRDFIASKGENKILVFVETKRTADFLASYLSTQDLNSTSIHGDRFQSQREEALAQFKAGVRNILVATSVAARGLDIRGVSHVVNYDLPKEVDEYVHRIGRTGRVGNKGYALSFYDDENDGPIAKNLLKIFTDAKQEVPGWLETAAATSGHSQTYHGVGNFAATDVRGQGGSYYKEQSAQAFGGPSPAAADEDNWD